MPADDLGSPSQFFVFLGYLIFVGVLKILPGPDFIERLEDASELVGVKVKLLEIGASLSDCSAQTCSQRVERIS